MSKIIIYIAQSLNGKIAREDGSIDWLTQFDGEDYGYHQFIDSVQTILIGNKTYKQVLTFGDEFPYKNKKVYVFTRNNQVQKDENVSFISSNISDFISNLKNSTNENIWLVGGAEIITYFLENKLVEELQLFTIPIIITSGINLMDKLSHDCKLNLSNSKIYKNGVVEAHYEIIY